MKKKGVSRRDFLKTSGAGAAALTAVSAATPEVQAQSSASRTQVFAALGDTIIPRTLGIRATGRWSPTTSRPR